MALAGGHFPSVADAIMDVRELSNLLLRCFLAKINEECLRLCQHTKILSPFHKIDPDKFCLFQWKHFIDDLSHNAPVLLKVLSSITDRQKTATPIADSAHQPGLCMAVAVLLKQRNREMCGLQSVISLLLYSSHVDKQVGDTISTCIKFSYCDTNIGVLTSEPTGSVYELHWNNESPR